MVLIENKDVVIKRPKIEFPTGIKDGLLNYLLQIHKMVDVDRFLVLVSDMELDVLDFMQVSFVFLEIFLDKFSKFL